jgi:serine/threonine protein phosphatase PrpC
MSVQNIKASSLEAKYGLRIDSEIETRQLGQSKQDHVAHGNYSSSPEAHTYWIAVFDGHGNNQTANQIRKAPLDDFMQTPIPWARLQSFIDTDPTANAQTKLKSGSTMTYAEAKVSPTGIEVTITNIGDSTTCVFLNDELIFVTTPQDYDNGIEMIRLIKENRVAPQTPLVKKDSNFEVLSPTTLRTIGGTYVDFVSPEGGQILSMSQSLGHGGITGINPDVTEFRFQRTDTIRIVCFSDGVSDVLPVTGAATASTIPFMTTTATLLDEAERRWKQEWNVHSGTDLRKIFKTSFPKNGYDDCCCTMLTIQPVIVSVAPPSPTCVVDTVLETESITEEETDIYA